MLITTYTMIYALFARRNKVWGTVLRGVVFNSFVIDYNLHVG